MFNRCDTGHEQAGAALAPYVGLETSGMSSDSDYVVCVWPAQSLSEACGKHGGSMSVTWD